MVVERSRRFVFSCQLKAPLRPMEVALPAVVGAPGDLAMR